MKAIIWKDKTITYKDKKGNVITEKLKQPKKEMPEYVSIFHLHLYN